MVMAGAEEGGLENHVVALSNQLSKNHQVQVIAHAKFRDRLQPRVIFLAAPMESGRRDLILKIHLIRLLKGLSPDLIHAHGNKAAALLSSIRRWLKCPCIGTLHSQKRNVKMFEKMDGVIGVSDGVLENLEHSNKRRIYNGIDLYEGPAFCSERLLADWRLPAGRKLCMTVGRLVPVKGFASLIKAWQRIDHNLVILGDGQERENLQRLACKTGVEDRICFAGYRDDLRAILPAADILIISSEREGFNMVMAEALMASVPVVSTRVAGPREILPDQYLCEPSDIAALAEIVKTTLAQIQEAQRIFKPVFQRARTQFVTEVMLEQTQAFYQEVLIAGQGDCVE